MSFVSTTTKENPLDTVQMVNGDGTSFWSRKLQAGMHFPHAFQVHVNCVATSKQPVLLVKYNDADLGSLAEYIHGRSPFSEHQFAVVSCRTNPFESYETAFAQLISPRQAIRSEREATFLPRGTLYFDDLEFLPQELQTLLSANIDHNGLIRLMNRNAQEVEIRVMASATKDIWRKCQDGLFQAEILSQISRLTVHCCSQFVTGSPSSENDESLSCIYVAEEQ